MALDYRNGGIRDARVEDVLSEAQEAAALKLADAFEAAFCAFDFKVAADGKIYYLECNPAPMFRGLFDDVAGGAITRGLLNFLVGDRS